MDVDRRSLMKGIFAGGAVLAFGATGWARVESSSRAGRRCALLLGGSNSELDAAFERGARVVTDRNGVGPLEIVKLESGLLAETNALIERIERCRGARWIAVLDDGSAAVFQELVRIADVRLLSRGSHASSEDGSTRFRHAWMTASPMWSAGALLASRLADTGSSYSITESFLDDTQVVRPQLECDDFLARSDDWAECVGQAVTASAFGFGAGRDLPADRAVVHATSYGKRRPAVRSFTSFVVDL